MMSSLMSCHCYRLRGGVCCSGGVDGVGGADKMALFAKWFVVFEYRVLTEGLVEVLKVSDC